MKMLCANANVECNAICFILYRNKQINLIEHVEHGHVSICWLPMYANRQNLFTQQYIEYRKIFSKTGIFIIITHL